MIEIVVKDGHKIIVHGSICDKYKFGMINHLEILINDEDNKRELREEKPLEDTTIV